MSESKYNPWPAYFVITAGIMLVVLAVLRIMDGDPRNMDYIKIAAGVGGVGYGVYKLSNKK